MFVNYYLYLFYWKGRRRTFCSWFFQQFRDYVVIGAFLGDARVLYQFLFDGDTYIIFSKQLLEFLEGLQAGQRQVHFFEDVSNNARARLTRARVAFVLL